MTVTSILCTVPENVGTASLIAAFATIAFIALMRILTYTDSNVPNIPPIVAR